jgi:hypothetical protein
VRAYIDPFVRAGVRAAGFMQPNLEKTTLKLLAHEANVTAPEVDRLILKRLDAWVELYERKEDAKRAGTVKAMKEPFAFFEVEPPADAD